MRDFSTSTNVFAPWLPRKSTLILLFLFTMGLTQLDFSAYIGTKGEAETVQPGTVSEQIEPGESIVEGESTNN